MWAEGEEQKAWRSEVRNQHADLRRSDQENLLVDPSNLSQTTLDHYPPDGSKDAPHGLRECPLPKCSVSTPRVLRHLVIWCDGQG